MPRSPSIPPNLHPHSCFAAYTTKHVCYRGAHGTASSFAECHLPSKRAICCRLASTLAYSTQYLVETVHRPCGIIAGRPGTCTTIRRENKSGSFSNGQVPTAVLQQQLPSSEKRCGSYFTEIICNTRQMTQMQCICQCAWCSRYEGCAPVKTTLLHTSER
jgi:hypothetical protein